MEQQYNKAKTYSDFNSFLISQIVNKIWDYDTLFVKLSNLNSVFEDGYKFLISNSNMYSKLYKMQKSFSKILN